MKPKNRSVDVIHHGLVIISDGKSSGRPARLELTRDSLTVQVPLESGGGVGGGRGEDGGSSIGGDGTTTGGPRVVTLKRSKDGGLGISVKGGTDVESAYKVPVLISKIFKDQPAEKSGGLFVGDAILEVNGTALEGKTHDQVVKVLKEAGEEVRVVVKHYIHMTPYLRTSSLRRDVSGSALERMSDTGTWRSSMRAQSEYDQRSIAESTSDGAPEGWRVLLKIPLPMAYLTRYLWGTDKIRCFRQNAFEVRAVDGTSSGIVHCEEEKVMEQWVRYISANITQLNNKSIKMSNKFLHPSELIVYLGWVGEKLREGVEGELWHQWEPRFLILKGSDVCVFESPPLSSEDLNRCIYSEKIFETSFKEAKEGERLDKKESCFWVERATPGLKHYFSVESAHQVAQIEASWHRATYYAVTRLQTKTFACNFESRPSGLVLDLRNGFALFDIQTKRYLWQYKFSQLKASADDGKMRLQLVFYTKNNTAEECRDLDCADLYPLVYTMHAFFVTRLISLDPDYLKAPWK